MNIATNSESSANSGSSRFAATMREKPAAPIRRAMWIVAIPPRAIWRCRTYLPTVTWLVSSVSLIYCTSSLLEELDRNADAPEVEVLERSIGLDRRPPHGLRVLVVVGREPARRADAERQIGQRLERRDERVRRERALV